MDMLDNLEKRISTVSRLLGSLNERNAVESEKSSDVVESLISTHALLNGAISGHEQVAAAFGRAAELERYLDPNFLEDNQLVRSKEVYLNAILVDLYAQCERLEHIKKLEPTLGAEYFRNIPNECSDKLKQISQNNVEFAQQSELIEESLILAMRHYGEIQSGIIASLSDMTKRLENVEKKINQKNKQELEKVV